MDLVNQKKAHNMPSNKPIILLRRSSCGSISNKRSAANDNNLRTLSSQDSSRKKLPRLNSMPNIKQTQKIVQYGNFPCSNVEQNFIGTSSGIKIEPYDMNKQAAIWTQNTASNNAFFTSNMAQSYSRSNQAMNLAKHVVINNNGVPQVVGTLSDGVLHNEQQFGRIASPSTISIMRFDNGRQVDNCTDGLVAVPIEQQQYSNIQQLGKFYCGSLQGTYLENENIRPHSLPNNMEPANCLPVDVQSTCHLSQEMMSRQGIQANVVDDSLTNITWLGHMGVNNSFLPMQVQKNGSKFRHLPLRSLKGGRPPYSYMALIQFAINSSPTRRMTLRQIYLWIEETFPYFKHAKPGWKNSIRHNLSLHDIFIREVSSTSKASFWTLRPDLNMRPLTLESVKGDAAQHMFQTCNFGEDSPWTIGSKSSGQKQILPRFSDESQPYVLVPLKESMKGSIGTPQSTSTIRRASSTRDCSSLFTDSGFHSDVSLMTPSTSRNRLSSGYEQYHYDSTIGSASSILLEDQNLYPAESTSKNENKGGSRKRPRKQPLTTLNDSLNNSLHFDETRLENSPGSEKKAGSSRIRDQKENSPLFGPCSNSFSEILNDLETPYKALFSGNVLFDREDTSRTPPQKKCKKYNLQKISPGFNEDIDAILTRHNNSPIRFFKSEKIDSPPMSASSVIDNYKNGGLYPTSTPICDEKYGKKTLRSFTPSRFLRTSPEQNSGRTGGKSKGRNLALSAFSVDQKVKEEVPSSPSNVFKQNDLVSSNVPASSNKISPDGKEVGGDKLYTSPEIGQSSSNENAEPVGFLPSVFGGDSLAFNNSFSKLLDLSGISLLGTSGCSVTQFSDIADVSWSNIPDA